MFKCLLEDPYSLAFGLYMLRVPEEELRRQFAGTADRQTLQAALKACCNFSDFQLYHFFKDSEMPPLEMEVLNASVAKGSG